MIRGGKDLAFFVQKEVYTQMMDKLELKVRQELKLC